VQAADKAGAETLTIMQAAPRYNRWQFRRIAPYLGSRVCEVGAGIGNMSALIAESGREQLVLTGLDPAYRESLQTRFADSPT
jgi:ubiquinone/menaquinone biosynthesis C-methylase UbiE